jgi:hypothetical protein
MRGLRRSRENYCKPRASSARGFFLCGGIASQDTVSGTPRDIFGSCPSLVRLVVLYACTLGAIPNIGLQRDCISDVDGNSARL